MAGVVFVSGQRVDKPGTKVDRDAEIEVREDTCPYVGRGGLKLEKAIDDFHLDLQDDICMDIGASTGGFTDCMLINGAGKVYAVDVGYGQLDWKLRNDPRVMNMERCNIRYLDTSEISERMDFISIDVSFISLGLVLPVAAELLADRGEMVCLVKPQFEAGREQVGKKGIVKDEKVHRDVILKTLGFAEDNGLHFKGLSYSPITGAKGNIEFLLYVGKDGKMSYNLTDVTEVVREAHMQLDQ